MKIRIALLSFILIIITGGAVFGETLLSLPHNGEINDICSSQDSQYLFTAGADGKVQVWDTYTKKVIQSIRISHLPLYKIVKNPVSEEIAVVEKYSDESYHISVWNWEKRKKRFSYTIEELPLHMEFSPKGTYLVFSKTDWNSLTFLDGKTGKRLPYLMNGFGIVSSFLISSSEQTIMTYNISGSIQYWDISTGKSKRTLSTNPNLTAVSISENQRYLVGFSEGVLYLIDLVTGEQVSSMQEEGVIATFYRYASRSIYVLKRKNNASELIRYRVSGFFLIPEDKLPIDAKASSFIYANSIYVTVQNSGSLFSLNRRTGSLTPFTTAELAGIEDLAFSGDTAVITSRGKLFLIKTSFFISSKNTSYQEEFSFYHKQLPSLVPYGLISLGNSRFILWEKNESGPGYFYFYNSGTDTFDFPQIMKNPIVQIKSNGREIVILENDGTCTIKKLSTLDDLFTYTSFGIQSIDFAGKNRLVAGKQKTFSFDSSLVEINIETGETVFINDPNLYTYEVVYEENKGRLYSLGIAEKNGSMQSVLKAHTGSHFEYGRPLLTRNSEDHSASVILDPENGSIFTSLGFDTIRKSTGYSFAEFESTERIPRALRIHNGYIYSLNRDSSISVYKENTGKLILELYILENDRWIILFANGKYRNSYGVEHLLTKNKYP